MPISPYIRELRALVGTRRLLVPSVTGVVRDSAGRVLFVRERSNDVWAIPGGMIEPDESPEQAVTREVREETGVEVVPAAIVGVFGGPQFVVRYENGDEIQFVMAMFACSVVGGKLGADDETTDLRYLDDAEARRLPLARWLPHVLPSIYSHE